jgi:RNA polymerase sigma factor (sigma-70 family)
MYDSRPGPEPNPNRGGSPQLDPAAAQFFADVFVEAKTSCCKELQRRGCSAEEAEEIFMTTFEKVMRLIDPIARAFEPRQMIALLKISSKRVLIDDRRHRAVLREVDLERVGALTDDAAATPDEVVEDREIAAIGREAMSTLNPRDRRIFALRYQLSLSPKEVRDRVAGLSARAYRRRIEKGNAEVLEAFDAIASGRRCIAMKRLKLNRHAQGLASASETKEIELHLAHCLGCRRYYRSLQQHADIDATREPTQQIRVRQGCADHSDPSPSIGKSGQSSDSSETELDETTVPALSQAAPSVSSVAEVEPRGLAPHKEARGR